MSLRGPRAVLVLALVSWAGMALVPQAHAQWAVFGLGGEDGGDAAPTKLFTNPWRADAGPETDGGGSWMDKVKGFTSGGSGAGFLRTRAPAIADLVDSDASILPSSKDGGSGLSWDLPSFGAKLDGGIPDAGPVVPPVVRVARPRDDVTPVTAWGVPPGLVWAHVPEVLGARLDALLPRDGGTPTFATIPAATRTALWDAAAAERGWAEGAAAFVLGEVGRPVPAALVALGVRRDAHGSRYYAGFVAPRDGVQPVNPRVVLAASPNVGNAWPVQTARDVPAERVRRAVSVLGPRLEVPFGMPRPVPGATQAVSLRTAQGVRVVGQVRQARRASGVPLCFEFTLDAQGHLVDAPAWSPVCDHAPVAAVDADGDGNDEVVWREGAALTLRRYPGGEVLDADPAPDQK